MVFHFPPQRTAADTQDTSGHLSPPPGLQESLLDGLPFIFPKGWERLNGGRRGMGFSGDILPLGEMFPGDDMSLDKDKGVFQDPLELPDVARPVILLEKH